MAKTQQIVRKKNHANRIPGAVPAIIFAALVLLVVLLVRGAGLQQRISINDARITDLNKQIESEEKRTGDIEALQEYMKSDEYLEQTAKEKLGFVKDGEIIFKEN